LICHLCCDAFQVFLLVVFGWQLQSDLRTLLVTRHIGESHPRWSPWGYCGCVFQENTREHAVQCESHQVEEGGPSMNHFLNQSTRMSAFYVRQIVWPALQFQFMKHMRKLLHSGHCFFPDQLLFVAWFLLPKIDQWTWCRN
jgi:hypothetical protein